MECNDDRLNCCFDRDGQDEKDDRLLDMSKRLDYYHDHDTSEVNDLSSIRKVENLSPKYDVEDP